MFKQGLREEAEGYFSSLNSMTKRILTDIATTKTLLGDTWTKLSNQDKCELIMKEFVSPVVQNKYSYMYSSINEVDCFPNFKIATGAKYVVDEEHGPGKQPRRTKWRDEYSGPFSWETRSQMDLRYVEDEPVEEYSRSWDCGRKPLKNDIAVKLNDAAKSSSVPKIPAKISPKIDAKIAKLRSYKDVPAPKPPIAQEQVVIPVAEKSHQLLQPMEPMGLSLPSPATESTNLTNDLSSIHSMSSDDLAIPKTGFDFLDNW